MSSFKMMVANLSLGARRADRKANLVRLIAELIMRETPDILLAQEGGRILPLFGSAGAVMRDFSRFEAGHSKDYLGQIGHLLNSEYALVFSPSILNHPAKKSRTGVSSSEIWGQGNCIFISRRIAPCLVDFWGGHPVASPLVEEIQLPRLPKHCLYAGSRNSEQRIVQVIRLCIANQDIVLFNLHLTTMDGEREKNIAIDKTIDKTAQKLRAKQITEVIAAITLHQNLAKNTEGSSGLKDTIYVAAGDFNETLAKVLSHEAAGSLLKALVLGSTRPHPKLSVDNVLVDNAHKAVFDKVRILVTKKQDRIQSHPQNDVSHKDLLKKMVDNGVDHWPIVLESSI